MGNMGEINKLYVKKKKKKATELENLEIVIN